LSAIVCGSLWRKERREEEREERETEMSLGKL